jgi:hypothetical protein
MSFEASATKLAGGASAILAQYGPTVQNAQPTVQERLDDVRSMTEQHHSFDASRDIAEVMADPNITQADRDLFLAGIIEMAGGRNISDEGAERLRRSLDSLGRSDGAADAAESIGRQVAAGTLGAADLSALFGPAPAGTDGVRTLFTDITDGRVLNRVANDLLSEARAIGSTASWPDQAGYDRALLAAADIANMAAANGSPAAARAVIREINAAVTAGVPRGDLPLLDRLLIADTQSIEMLGERSAIRTLATLLNSATDPATTSDAMRREADTLFANLLRTASETGLGSNGLLSAGSYDTRDIPGAIDQLGQYFEANAERLVRLDWRLNASGTGHDSLVLDFMRHVVLNPDYAQRDRTAQALGTLVDDLNARIVDTTLTLRAREDAARSLGIVLGSLNEAGQQFVAESRLSAQRQADLIGGFVDVVFRTAIRAGGMPSPGHPGSEDSMRGIIGAWTDGHVAAAAAAAEGRVDAVLGALADTLTDYRRALGEDEVNIPGSILDALDFRALTRDG